MSSRIRLFALGATLCLGGCSSESNTSTSNEQATGSGPSGSTSAPAPTAAMGAPSAQSSPPATSGLATTSNPGPPQVCTAQCVSDCAAVHGTATPGTCSAGMCCSVPPGASASSETADLPTTVSTGVAASTGSSTGAQGAESGQTEPGTEPAIDASVYDYAAAVESTSDDCEVPDLAEPSELSTIEKLPDPFKALDGTFLTKKSEWRCRRQEIRKQAEKYVYGEKPTPELVSGAVSNTKIDVHVEALGKAIDFSAKVVLPTKGQAPYAAIINVGSSGMTLGESRILDMGVAVIYYNHYDLGKEGTPEQSRGKPNPGKFYDIYGGDHSAGLLMAWAWGASRLIDVLQQADGSLIDVGKLGVTGCSRNGKGAFAIGVFDERIALTIPQETSTAGVPVYRLVDILNTERTDHNYFGLNWFSNDFEPFVYTDGTSKVVKLPIDTHELVALVAPRGLLVLDNPHQTQMSAPAGHLATAAGAQVYQALGVADHVSYHSNVAGTPHCSYKDEYTDLLTRNVSRFLKHEDAKTGDFTVGQGGDGKLADWKDWATPTLAD